MNDVKIGQLFSKVFHGYNLWIDFIIIDIFMLWCVVIRTFFRNKIGSITAVIDTYFLLIKTKNFSFLRCSDAPFFVNK